MLNSLHSENHIAGVLPALPNPSLKVPGDVPRRQWNHVRLCLADFVSWHSAMVKDLISLSHHFTHINNILISMAF